MLLDSHQHFWRYDSIQYPWMPAGSRLLQDWLPADLEALQKPLNLDGSIVVQVRQNLAETDWLLGIADADPRVKGVVGWVDLLAPDVDVALERLARHPKLVGIRHVVQDEPDDQFLLGADFLRGVAQLASYGLTYDVLIYPKQLPAAIKFVEKFPELPMVLDHIAKPLMRDRIMEPWRQQIETLAKCPNLFCKVSGLVTEADHQHWQPTDLRPYLDLVFAAFGPERLMWGSDWPVCLLAAEYKKVWDVIREYAADLSPAQQAGLFGGNCARFYLQGKSR